MDNSNVVFIGSVDDGLDARDATWEERLTGRREIIGL